MTGKNSNQLSNFVIQLTPKFRIIIDRFNCSLYQRVVKSDKLELLDDELDGDYRAVGHFSVNHPNLLVRELITSSLIKQDSPVEVSLKQYVDLFESHVTKLSKRIGKVTNVADGLTQVIVDKTAEIDSLKVLLRNERAKVTRLKRKYKCT